MLRLSVAVEECLNIGKNIRMIFLGISEGNARVMIDAPREIPITRSKDKKYMSVIDYKKMKRGILQAVEEEMDGGFKYPEGSPRLSEWINNEELRDASFGIYGTGRFARECYNQILIGGTQRVLAYVNPQRTRFDRNINVSNIEALRNPEIDKIIVAMQSPDNYKMALGLFDKNNIPTDKAVWIPGL